MLEIATIIPVIGTVATGCVAIWVAKKSSGVEVKKLDYSVFKDAQEANQRYLDRLQRDLEKAQADLAARHTDNHELREEIRVLEEEIDKYRERVRKLEDELYKLKRKLTEQGIEVD